MRKAIIIGADPAGLTTAYELLQKTDIQPLILEKTGDVGLPSERVTPLKRLFTWRIDKILRGPKVEPLKSWREFAQQIQNMGGEILLHQQIYSLYSVNEQVCSLHTINNITGELTLFEGNYFLSSKSHHEIIEVQSEYHKTFTNLFLINQTSNYRHRMPQFTSSN
jgi:hypothetical protein